MFEDRRIRVSLDLPSTIPAVAIDRAQMEQVFFNLMKNALEAMKDGGELSIEIAHDDTYVSVMFRDTGAAKGASFAPGVASSAATRSRRNDSIIGR